MSFARWNLLPALGVGLLALACGGGGGGGGTGPLGPPAVLAKSGGDAQSWFFNNALPDPFSVTVRDANNRAVPGVLVDWSIITGTGGALSANQSTTNSSGVATTVLTLGMGTNYVVRAGVTGLALTQDFTATAMAPPLTQAVSLSGLRFNPSSVVVKVNQGTAGVGEVTWTWNDGAIVHNVTFAGSGPPGGNIPNRDAGSVTRTFNVVGAYNYTCTNHGGMNGSVTVVN